MGLRFVVVATEIKNYDPNGTWQVGTLHVSEPATLFPFEINAKDHGGVRYVTEFEIHKLTSDKLVLVYPDNGVWDGWWKVPIGASRATATA